MSNLIGLESTVISSDMRFEYDHPILTIGTVADNYWGGWCASYDREFIFNIDDIEALSEFSLREVGFDDYLWIKLNDQTIYVGPDGGNKIEVTSGRVNNGSEHLACERGTNWHLKDLNIDLLPLLVAGNNVIFTRTIVGGMGESWIKFCCNSKS